jgi:hypothetical protein
MESQSWPEAASPNDVVVCTVSAETNVITRCGFQGEFRQPALLLLLLARPFFIDLKTTLKHHGHLL